MLLQRAERRCSLKRNWQQLLLQALETVSGSSLQVEREHFFEFVMAAAVVESPAAHASPLFIARCICLAAAILAAKLKCGWLAMASHGNVAVGKLLFVKLVPIATSLLLRLVAKRAYPVTQLKAKLKGWFMARHERLRDWAQHPKRQALGSLQSSQTNASLGDWDEEATGLSSAQAEHAGF